MFKRFTSMFLAIIMIIGVFPVSAMAEGEELSEKRFEFVNSDDAQNFEIFENGSEVIVRYSGSET
ncbi:MAG: hypothetical protein J6C34_08450 [Oscillospiraceae bacterium]|nr:hypothetical protein [Oscillospiraceae bacterium]MBQ8595254.1 hypothetical protein [Oscillospiraceae bacterium]